jgi:uncharacterized membrane protein (UPF0136 family)
MSLARISLVALVASSLLCVLAGSVLACDGPHAGELIEQNRSIVNAYGFATIFLFLATVAIYFVRSRTGILPIVLSLIVGFFHPFWHYGGGGGDCGRSFVEIAKYVTIILAGILIIQAALWRLRSSRIIVKRT